MRKTILKILAILILVAAVFFGYNYYKLNVSTTKIAFVKYPEFMYADIKKANENSFIETSLISVKDNDLDELQDYDVVYIWGMAYRPTEAQMENLKKLVEKNIPLYVFIATSPEADITTLNKKELKEVEAFFKNRNLKNNKKLLNYSRKVLHAKKWFVDEVELAETFPKNYFFNPATDAIFETREAFETFYKEKGFYKENAQNVLVVTSNLTPENPYMRQPYYALIEELEKRNLNVYAIAGMSDRMKHIDETPADLIVYIPHGRLAAGTSDEMISILKKKNVPVLGAEIMFESFDKWQNSQMGMTGGMLGQSIISPELDGMIVPYVIGAKFPNEDGLMVFKEIPERINTFSSMVENYLSLQKKKNKDKKLAIFYYKGPGQNAMSSEGLEITPSLLNLLNRLQKEGYTTGKLPKTSKELYARIQKEGKLLGPYAKGAFEKFIKTGNPALVHKDTLQHWMQKDLQAKSINNVKKIYGKVPGEYMVLEKDSILHLAVAKVQFGNIVLMPQPLPAVGDDAFKLIHGVKKAPPYPYIGAYLWARNSFKADAIMHFGTHGSLEFTPYKQTGLSSLDWGDVLIGDKPHFYYYVVGNVGEAMIAKRRSYASLVSHLTPAFAQADLNDELLQLFNAYHSYISAKNNASLTTEYSNKIRDLVLNLKMDKELNFDLSKDKELTESQLDKISKYLHGIEQEKITMGLYTLGQVFDEKQLKSTLRMMSIDRIAYSKATLDVSKGKITEKQKNNPVFFDKNYRTPALKLINSVLNNPDLDVKQFIDQADLARAEKWQKENPEKDFWGAMSGMISIYEKEEEKEESKSHLENQDVRIKELVFKAAVNPKKREILEKLKDQAQYKKATNLLDRATRKKVREVAKMIPKMKEKMDIILLPEMLELVDLMQLEANYKLVYSLLDDPDFIAGIKAKEKELQEAQIVELIKPSNSKILFSTLKGKAFDDKIVKLNKKELVAFDSILKIYLDNASVHDKITKNDTNTKAVVKILSSEKALADVAKAADKVKIQIAVVTEKEKNYVQAVLDYNGALLSIQENYKQLKNSPELELKAILNDMNGGYTEPSSGGDVVRNPKSVPTGRNLYAINAEMTPSEEAWKVGKEMAEQLIAAHKNKHGKYPKKVAFTLWGGEFIRGEGSTIAQVFYMLGVAPIRSGNGIVQGVKLIPSKELGRPRIDVVVQTSGQFRDFASSRIFLINDAVALAAKATEDEKYDNYAKIGAVETESALKENGFSPEEARKLSTARVFGGVNGNYGTAIMGMVENGDRWETDTEVAEQYKKNMGAIYTKEQWGAYKSGLFEASLQNTEMIVQPRSSNSWGALSLDHVYEFMGGLTNAVRNTTGKDPDGYFVDTRSQQNSFVQTVDEAIWTEAQSTLFNPKYIKELAKGEASSAEVFAETTRDLYGWNVMKPDAIDSEMWDKMHEVYVQDKFEIGIQKFFKEQNPFALQEMTAVMLETARKGYWKPDEAVIKEISELHAKLVAEFDAGCSGFVCDNAKLKDYIAKNISPEAKTKYQDKINEVRQVSGEQETKKNIELKKVTEPDFTDIIKNNKKLTYTILGVFLFLIFAIIYGRLRRK